MSIVIRAHFDGKCIVPDEPVDLPVDRQIKAELTLVEPEEAGAAAARARAWKRLKSRKVYGTSIPLEALRRENMYEDRL